LPSVRRLILREIRRRVTVQGFSYGTRAGDGRTGGTGRPVIIEGEFSEMPDGKQPTHPPSGWTRH